MISGSPPCWETSITHQYNVRPPSYKLVNKSPSNYSYLCTINHSYWVIWTNLDILGATHQYWTIFFAAILNPANPRKLHPPIRHQCTDSICAVLCRESDASTVTESITGRLKTLERPIWPIFFCKKAAKRNGHTVDGRNPAPPWMVETLVIMG